MHYIYIYIYIYNIYIYIYIYNIVYIVIGAERPTLLLAHLMPNLKLHHRSYLNSKLENKLLKRILFSITKKYRAKNP